MLALVDNVLVRLVGDDEQVLVLGDLRELLEILPGQHAAGRVVRRVEIQDARLRRDRLLDVRDVPAPADVFTERHLHGHTTRLLDDRHGRRPLGIGNDHFIAGLEDRLEDREQAVRTAVGDDHFFVGADRDAVLLAHLFGKGLAQRRDAARRQVVRAVVGHGLGDALLESFWSVEGNVALVEAERILDGVHHVANANDG